MLQAFRPGIQCQLCHVTFSDHSALSVHYDTAHAQSSSRPQHPDARYECEVCGKRYMARSKLKLHMADVHGIGELKTFQCDYCEKVFKQKVHLKSHMKFKHKNFA